MHNPDSKGRIARREFLARSGLTTAGVALGSSSLASLLAACGNNPTSGTAQIGDPGTSSGRFKGVSLVVAGPAGQLDFMKKMASTWADQTGAQVRVDEIPFGEINQKVLAAMTTKVYIADVINIGSGMGGDLMGGGYALAVPGWAKDRAGWNDIFAIFRNDSLSWGGTAYALPWGGDELDYFYRRDVFEDPKNQSGFKAKFGSDLKPAQTWAEYAQIAEYFTGWDWSGTGKPGYGLVELPMRKNQGWNGFMTRAAAYAKAPDDPAFFFDPDSMKPRINNPGFVRALEEWHKVQQFGPPGMQSFGWIENAQAFVSAVAAQDIQWPSIVPMAHDPSASKVVGKVGYALTPGVSQYWDSKKGSWASASTPNRATFMGFGGWVNVVPSTSKNAAAAFDLASFFGSADVMNQAVVTAGTGMNPSRGSQLDASLWTKAGFADQDAQGFVGMIKGALSDPNAVFDLRLPGFPEYKDAVELAVSKVLSGQQSAQDALNDAANAWGDTTNRFGTDKQRKLYRQSIGL